MGIFEVSILVNYDEGRISEIRRLRKDIVEQLPRQFGGHLRMENSCEDYNYGRGGTAYIGLKSRHPGPLFQLPPTVALALAN